MVPYRRAKSGAPGEWRLAGVLISLYSPVTDTLDKSNFKRERFHFAQRAFSPPWQGKGS